MAVLIGVIVVLGAIFGGFILEGGHLGPLFQPYELLMIVGGAIGAFIISNDAESRQATLKAIPTLFQSARQNRAMYLDLLSLLYDIFVKVRKEGLMSIEGDVENPADSALFANYPRILLERKLQESSKVYQCVKVSIIASMNGYAPSLAVEFGQKLVSASRRPNFKELEAHLRPSR